MSNADPAAVNALQRELILVADDDLFARKTLVQALRAAGFTQVVEAENGDQVLHALKSNKVSLLISDVQMPGFSGVEMLRRIRAGESPAQRDLRVVLHTSFAHREVLAAAMALEVNGFLVKPVKAASVRGKVEQALTERFRVRGSLVYSAVSTDLVCVPDLPDMPADSDSSTPVVPEDGDLEMDCIGQEQGRWVDLLYLMPGEKLLDDVRTNEGTLLLRRGNELTEPQINRLVDLGDVIANRRARVSSTS